MAISLVGVGAAVFGTGDITPVYPAAYTAVAGDVAVIHLGVTVADTGEYTTPAGWTKVETILNEIGAFDGRGTVYLKVLAASESLPTITGDTVDQFCAYCEIWRGVDTTTPQDATATTSEANNTLTFTPTGITTVTDGAVVVSSIGIPLNGGDANITTANSFTLSVVNETTAGANVTVGSAYREVATAGAVTMPVWEKTQFTGVGQWTGITFALRPAPPSTGGWLLRMNGDRLLRMNSDGLHLMIGPGAPPAGITVAVGTATEADTVLPVGRIKRRTLGVVVETDTVQPVARRKQRTVGTAIETDTVQPVARRKSRTVGLATETDTALPVVRIKRRTVGLAEETDTVVPVTVVTGGATVVGVGTAEETDTVLAVRRVKRRTLGVVVETATVQPVTRRKQRTLGAAIETDTVQPVARRKSRAVGTATETCTVQPATRRKQRTVGTAVEVDSLFAVARRKRRTVGTATELDALVAVTRRKRRAIGTASETDAVLGVARIKLVRVGSAEETDTVLAVFRTGGALPPTVEFAPITGSRSTTIAGRARRSAAGATPGTITGRRRPATAAAHPAITRGAP